MSAADEFRQLDNSHVQLLRDFRCHQRNTWTKDVQRTIRADVSDLVAGLLEDVDAKAVGCFRFGELIAVGVYSAGEHFEVLSLAVSTDFQGEGVGINVKRHLMGVAGELGFKQVFSRVHRANHPMLSINYRLGAWVEVEEDDREFHICVANV